MADYLAQVSPLLLGILLLINSLTAFSITRQFSLIFGGKPKAMTVRSPEGLWALVLPMAIVAGFSLHVPLLLAQWQLLPAWGDINFAIATALVGSTLLGGAISGYLYLNDAIPKPIQLPLPSLQNFFAYDLYTAQLYKVTIVAVVGGFSSLIAWFDRFIIDGIVNLVGLVTLFSGQTLKYNATGQTQFYALSIVLGLTLMGVIFSWPLLSQIQFILGQ
jgi:NAD(P)H-quinone oxidoreductase subunit 5